MVKLQFFQFRVTNLNLKNIKLHNELLTQFRLILEIQFYLCPVPLEGYQEKMNLIFWSRTKLRVHQICTIEPTSQWYFTWHFTMTSTWPLLIYPRLAISYTKFLFPFHYDKEELYMVILRLAYCYWTVFRNNKTS